ncbi:uncharacterized protein TNCT_16541 [Trichonephila clavata]|uniref:Uncharacterized protein n=1 Tax=Trichonephila clavata TaxID=2740835 RepID=A0A8X6FQP3_TRICU|nr:uncharacterized protein TNCT_16541 [Trichonephila clavata]
MKSEIIMIDKIGLLFEAVIRVVVSRRILDFHATVWSQNFQVINFISSGFSLLNNISRFLEKNMPTLQLQRMLVLSFIGTILIIECSTFPTETPESIQDLPVEMNAMLRTISDDLNKIVYRSAYPYLFQTMRLPPIETEDDRPRRTFPEVDSRGFEGEVFDEGFGKWYPMKRF